MNGYWNLLTVFRRELSAYFNSAIAYIFIVVFVLINGGLFMTQFFLISRADMQPFFVTLPYLLAVFLPAVTMRQWAEERRGNTLELLLTFPMCPQELVLGKFFAGLVFYLAALAGTLTIPIMLLMLGRPDMGAVWGGYLGAFFLGAFFLSAGIFISGFVRDQIAAFILAMMLCFGLHLLGTGFLAASIDGWIPGLGSFLAKFVGSAAHFDSFARGVVDNRDVLYFLIGTALFLVLNGFWMEGRMRPKARAIFASAVAVSAGIFLMANWLLSEIPLGRFDLTENRIYTVSPASKKILRDLKAPVNAKFYVSPSEKMPTGMKTLEQEVVGRLDELRIASRGKFQYKIFHMEASNLTEEAHGGEESLEASLQGKGIQPFQVQSIESDEVGVRLVYAAISLSYKEKPAEIIARLMPDSLFELEYMIVSKIFRMAMDKSPGIAMVAPYEEQAMDPNLMALLAQLGGRVPGLQRRDDYAYLERALEYEGYDVARIRLNAREKIPEGTKTLVVLEPARLSDRQQYEINRFLRGGGALFLGVQQHEYDYHPSGGQLRIRPRNLEPNVNGFLSSWGLEVLSGMLADEQSEMISLAGGAQLGPFAVSVPVKLPIQIIVPPSGMNQDLSITAHLDPLFYLWGSALKIDHEVIKAAGLDLQVLFSSSKNSWLAPFEERTLAPRDFGREAATAAGPFPLAVFVKGTFPNAFEERGVPAWGGKETGEEQFDFDNEEAGPEANLSGGSIEEDELAPVKPSPGKLILCGSATMFRKQLFQSGGHLNFFLNSVDILTLGEALVHIRSKRPVDRAIDRVSAPQKVFWRFFVNLLVPGFVIFFGACRLFLRRRAKQRYLKKLETACSS